MLRRNLHDLHAFVAIAREQSFTRAATQLGVTTSALSQSIRGLEERLGVRLLARTTRSVSTTAAGDQLLSIITPRFDDIEAELGALAALRDKPAGLVRLTCSDHVLKTILLPRLQSVLQKYPDIQIEFDVYYGFRDIVADRFDAGIRMGESIDQDMIALPITPPLRMAAVAAPSYFRRHAQPRQPKDLTAHNCINMRYPGHGGLYAWEFERDGRTTTVHVTGQLTFNTTPHMVAAALEGLGIAFLPEEEFAPHINKGKLVRVLANWCPPFPGYFLYYPSRRQPSPAFSAVLAALRAF